MNKNYSGFAFKYFLFSLLIFVLGVSYVYLSIKVFMNKDFVEGMALFLSSFIFYMISYFNFSNFGNVLNWLDLIEEKDMSLQKNFNYFLLKDVEDGSLSLIIVAFNISIHLEAKKLINYIIQDILLEEDYAFVREGKLYRVTLKEVENSEVLYVEDGSDIDD